MYGLASHESLSKRQFRWTKEVDESVRGNPAQRAMNQQLPLNNIAKNNIITIKNLSECDNKQEPYNSDDIDHLQLKYSKLKQNFKILKNIVDKTDSEIAHLKFEIDNRIKSLELSSAATSGIISRLQSLEYSLNEISARENIRNERSYINLQPNTEDSSDFSIPTKDYSEFEYSPFFIKEEYSGRDNKTILDNLTMTMVVDIVGLFNEIPIIYPFGKETNMPRFAELTVDMDFTDAEKIMNGTMYGIFKRRSDGIYIITITELYSDGEASSIDKFTLPLTIKCRADLILE